MKEQNEPVKAKAEMKEISPLKDFVIHTHEVHIEIKKGEKLEVPKMFLQNLKTEKVIK